MKIKLVIYLSFFTIGFGQVTTDTQYHGARQLALSGSDVAWQLDSFSPYHNPAALVWQKNLIFGISYEQLYGYSFFPHVSTAIGFPIKSFGTASVTYENMSVSYQSQKLTSEQAIGLTHAMFLQRDRNSRTMQIVQ